MTAHEKIMSSVGTLTGVAQAMEARREDGDLEYARSIRKVVRLLWAVAPTVGTVNCEHCEHSAEALPPAAADVRGLLQELLRRLQAAKEALEGIE